MRTLAVIFALAFSALPAALHAAEAETAALAAVNAARAQAGCAPLALNPNLQRAAKGHAAAMARFDFFSHTAKDGSQLKDRIDRAGYRFSAIAENIAAGQPTAGEVVATWLGSAGHKKNMLNCTYTDTGLALAYQLDDAPLKGNAYPFQYYWVQVFGRP